MRMHICWLNYAGPHTHDIAVSKLIGLLAKARPQALLFEGANPRHEHEWEEWKAATIPDDKVLVPGVIDSTNKLRRASRAGRAAYLPFRRHRRARARPGRNGLRLRHLCGPQSGLSIRRPGKAERDGRGARIATDRLWQAR